MRPLAPLIRRARGWLVADAANRCSDFPGGLSLGSDFLYLRTAGAASANVDERDSFSAVLARPWHWSFAEQRARSAGGALQSQVGFHTHAQVRHRTQIATLANLQVPAAEISPPARFATQIDPAHQLIISVRDQKVMLLENGAMVTTYPVSTSKFGLGDFLGRMTTPLGYLMVAQKIGDNAPVGAVFHNRRFTGEILTPNAPGRDPVVTRIIWLRGLEAQNAHAFYRCIYIHGTPQEKTIGRPASYGCIRMKSSDIAALYNQVPLGAIVQIIPDRLPKVPKASPARSSNTMTVQVEKSNAQERLASPSTSGSLTVEQMRMAGALAAERLKSQARKAQPVLNKGTAMVQNNPRA